MPKSAVALALFFAVSVAMLGVFVPFWPAWLEARGLSKSQIGSLVAAWAWSRGIAGPLFAHWVDRSGARRAWIVGLSVVSTLAFLPFHFARDFELLLGLTVVFGALHSQVIPLGENLIVFEARRLRFSYAGVRWFGSVSFLLVSVFAGWALDDGHAERAFPLALGFLALTCVAALALPREPAAAPAAARERQRSPWRELWARKPLLCALAGLGVLQAAHAAYYAYSTLHWNAAGHSTTTIGWLWAEGVVAEIALFALVGNLRVRIGEPTLLVLGVVGSLLRWAALGLTTDLEWLLATQWLHALTFGATHLAAMGLLARSVGVDLSASAQSVYSSVNIAVHATTVALTARLFDERGAAVFWPMLPIVLAGGALAWIGMARERARSQHELRPT